MTPLRAAPEISLRRCAANDDAPPRSEVIVAGAPTGSTVAGAVLEAAVGCDAGFLLFVTDDVPYEDALSIHLVDAKGQCIDSARLGRAYSSGRFADLRLEPPDRVRFRFTGGLDWSVRMLSQPQWRLPFNAEAPGVVRPFGFRRRFVVQAEATAR